MEFFCWNNFKDKVFTNREETLKNDKKNEKTAEKHILIHIWENTFTFFFALVTIKTQF